MTTRPRRSSTTAAAERALLAAPAFAVSPTVWRRSAAHSSSRAIPTAAPSCGRALRSARASVRRLGSGDREATKEARMDDYAVANLEQIDEIDDGRCPFRPLRHHFGITSFGVNAFTGHEAGDRIINEHDEEGENEELYL